MTNAELIQYYVNLLIIQYRTQEKAPAHIATLIEIIMIFELMRQVENGYNIETAIGSQLDIIGKYLGVDRVVTGTVFDREYYGYVLYVDIAPFDFASYSLYADPDPDVQTRTYKEDNQSLYTLNDEEFRQILNLKIIQNNSQYTPYDIDQFIQTFFAGNAIFIDRQDMSIAYIFDESVERLVTIANSELLIPKPAAVRISISFVNDINNIYGYATYGGSLPDWLIGYVLYSNPAPTGGYAKYE